MQNRDKKSDICSRDFVIPNANPQYEPNATNFYQDNEPENHLEDNINDSIPLPDSADDIVDQSRISLNQIIAQVNRGQNAQSLHMFQNQDQT